jgi:hypothetical protein
VFIVSAEITFGPLKRTVAAIPRLVAMRCCNHGYTQSDDTCTSNAEALCQHPRQVQSAVGVEWAEVIDADMPCATI